MHRLFAIVCLLLTTVVAACDSGAQGKVDASASGGRSFDGAVTGGSEAGGARIAAGGGTGVGGSTAKGGASGAGEPAATGGTAAGGTAGTSDNGGTTAGTSGTAGTGGTSSGTAGTGGTPSGAAGATSTSGTAGEGGTAGKTSDGGVGGTSGTAGKTGAGGVEGTAGKTSAGGTTAGGGTSGSATAADNVADVVVDIGLPGIGYLNGLFASVTVCVPGGSKCQTIDHVLVDTGSSGLRVLGSVLTLSLPAWTDDSGVALAECTQFVSSFTWGPLRSADIKIAGEQANGTPIQVIEGSTYPVPTACTGVNSNSAATLGSNGIIGISALNQDCGAACSQPPGTRSANPGVYYACSSSSKGGCKVAAVPVAKQVSNPVPLFSQDNNGTIIELPTVPADGAANVKGSLIFGIGTRSNNGVGQATVMPLDSSGTFLTSYPTTSSNPSMAFIDSGSNALYFPNSGTTRIANCTGSYSGFYCPRSTLSLSAKNQDMAGSVTMTVNFSVANTMTLLASQNNVAFNDLGGSSSAPSVGSAGMGAYFDWGLPFYFGRNVFTAIEGQSTPSGTGPFVAF